MKADRAFLSREFDKFPHFLTFLKLYPEFTPLNFNALASRFHKMKKNNPHPPNLCHFKAVFFHWATKRTLACSGGSDACHWTKLGNACGVGWPIESCLPLDWVARPVAEKGVVARDLPVRQTGWS